MSAGRTDRGLYAPEDFDPADFACAVRVERSRGSGIDTLRVIGIARNDSRKAFDLCGRFDFGGGYKPCPECPKPERPPVLYILPVSWQREAPFDGRRTHLDPGAELRDTLLVTFAPLDFEYAPGKITFEGSLWAGLPGGTFAQARCLNAEAGTAAIEVP